ncbi:hypothetical protein V8C86DRAFT_3128695 [Haematococcus lacustris]
MLLRLSNAPLNVRAKCCSTAATEQGWGDAGSVHWYRGRSLRARRCTASASQTPGGPDGDAWWQNLNKKRIQGPPQQQPVPEEPQGFAEQSMGEGGYAKYAQDRRRERQRVWDTMRASAQERYQFGQMPSWFNPAWLDLEEAPVNQILRETGDTQYQYDDTWLGRPYDADMVHQPELAAGGDEGDDGSTPWEGGAGGPWGGSRWGGGGGGWWREDDPYWMLRDWGDHPMRWWTLAYAAVVAVGGILAYSTHGSLESLFVGCAGAAWLALCSLAMSDMRNWALGELGVKMAFGACALLVFKDGFWGWQHCPQSGSQRPDFYNSSAFVEARRVPPPWEWLVPRLPLLNLTHSGWSALGMCALYVWTGTGSMVDGSLPMNPGGAERLGDIAMRHRVWERWGYGEAVM